MTIFSTVEEVREGVLDGVHDALIHWSEQSSTAVRSLPKLRDLVSRIIIQVKENHPEAKWRFEMHQDGEGWQLTVYSDDSSTWDINDLVRPLASLVALVEDLRLYLSNVGMEEADQEE